MAAPLALPATLPSAATMPATIKAALPAITVMLVNGGRDLLFALVILIAGWTVARWFGRWIHDALARAHHVDETLKPLISSFARYTILAITLVAVLGQFGVQTTSLIALLGAAGLAIGLALQGTLSNVASGVMLLILRPFRVNEKITGGGYSGVVEEIGLFQTVLITDDGFTVTVPNSTLFSGTITNETRRPTHRVNVTIDVDYRADLKAAIETLRALLAADGRVLQTPAPLVQVASLAGPAANIQALAWTGTADAGGVQADYLAAARRALLAQGIGPAQPLAAISPDPAAPKPAQG